jgi:TctA family transporter
MVEENLRVGLISSGGDWQPFVTRPIAGTLAGVLLLTMLAPLALRLVKRPRQQ